MTSQIQCQFLGGCEEVGRLSMILETNGMRFLFEYGMSPGKPPSFPLPPPPMDITLLTHAHLDHSGMIPWLCSRFDHTLLATQLTGEISNLLQKDTIKIAKMEGYSCPFSSSDIKDAEHSLEPIVANSKRSLGDDYLLKFHSAGHIPGSLMFELITEKKMLFTGDFNIVNTRLVKGTKAVSCDILFLETTYAGREHPSRPELEKQFLEKIEEVVHRGGVAVIPSFAVSRSQEIALVLRKAGFNVWFDGMGRKVSKMFLKHPKELRSVDDLKKSLNKINLIHSEHGRKMALKGDVILTSSGMMDGGPVLSYMNKLKNDKKSAVLLTGYQVEGTNSHLLINKGKLDFYGVIEDVSCEVQYYDFSAHAGHSELIDFARKCNPDTIVLFHGDNREEIVEPLQHIADVLTPSTNEIVNL
jgi:putative mRNA 3-end processing factor